MTSFYYVHTCLSFVELQSLTLLAQALTNNYMTCGGRRQKREAQARH